MSAVRTPADTGGGGVKNWVNFADVLYGCPLHYDGIWPNSQKRKKEYKGYKEAASDEGFPLLPCRAIRMVSVRSKPGILE